MFFSKKNWLQAPASGNVLPIEEVGDAVFSSKMMGGGFAITEHDGHVFAPVSGIVQDIFPTKHAISLKSDNGAIILLHMGLETVEMKGTPFTILVEKGQRVQPSDLLAQMDLAALEAADKDSVLIVVLVESDGTLQNEKGHVHFGEKLFHYKSFG